MERAPFNSQNRVYIIDAVRGFCILLVILYHGGYDLVMAGFLPPQALYNPVLNFLEPFFAGVFILTSGISANFSKNNLKRGVRILAFGLIISLVTFLLDPDFYVRFGILHFLGSAIIIYCAARPLLNLIPRILRVVLFAAGFCLTWGIPSREFNVDFLWFLGFHGADFSSSDYFPLLPWIFVFFIGDALSGYIIGGRLPCWFYSARCPLLEFIGKNTIWIYLAHQPVIMGVIWGLELLLRK